MHSRPRRQTKLLSQINDWTEFDRATLPSYNFHQFSFIYRSSFIQTTIITIIRSSHIIQSHASVTECIFIFTFYLLHCHRIDWNTFPSIKLYGNVLKWFVLLKRTTRFHSFGSFERDDFHRNPSRELCFNPTCFPLKFSNTQIINSIFNFPSFFYQMNMNVVI